MLNWKEIENIILKKCCDVFTNQWLLFHTPLWNDLHLNSCIDLVNLNLKMYQKTVSVVINCMEMFFKDLFG